MIGLFDVTYFDDAAYGEVMSPVVFPNDAVGTTLLHEMQRLSGTTLDLQGAVNIYAGTTGLSLVGALNVANGTTGLALQGVLNALAGTTGLGLNAAAEGIL